MEIPSANIREKAAVSPHCFLVAARHREVQPVPQRLRVAKRLDFKVLRRRQVRWLAG
jgi:hypothetical protein